MAGRPTHALPLALLALMTVAAGCGTTNVYTTDPTARLTANGRPLGRGQGSLTRRGFPGSTRVTVKTDDGREGQTVVRRRFTAFTLITGLFTYGVCLVACWEYPDAVLVPLPGPSPNPYGPFGPPPTPDQPGAPPGPTSPTDPWLTPPAGWQDKRAATAPE